MTTLLVVLFFFTVIVGIMNALFRLTCIFKKKCTWKLCPFRNKDPIDDLHMWGCTKCPFPFDEEERAAYRDELDRLKKKMSDYENRSANVS